MITFKMVVGDVRVDDGQSSTQAFTGWRLDPSPRTCVVVTTPGSKASVDVNGTNIELGPNSWLNVTAGAPHAPRHLTIGHTDVRLLIGRLWAVVHRNPSFDEEFSGGGGVRG